MRSMRTGHSVPESGSGVNVRMLKVSLVYTRAMLS